MISTPRDAEEKMKKIVSKVLPDVIRNFTGNVIEGTIKNIKTETRTADVELLRTGDTLKSVKYPRGMTGNVGDRCLVASADPKLRRRNYIIGIY
jgi:hypothetical protein